MAQSTITIRVDQELKKKFDNLCEDFGLSITSAFQIFMKAVVRERKIPFEIESKRPIDKKHLYMENLLSMRETAALYGNQDMSLQEINAEIDSARKKK